MKIILLFLSTLIAYAAGAQQKAAPAAGNDDYKEYPLKNTDNDAGLMAKTLRGLALLLHW